MRLARAFPLALSFFFLSALLACPSSSDTEPICIDAGVDPACTPPYEPSYSALFEKTLRPTCAKSNVSCHSSTGKQGGLDFDDVEASYATLTKRDVVVGRPECSPLVHRIVATDGNVRMPPGRSLDAPDQCAIVRWIVEGARR
jgi:hypothetical protein